MGKGSGTTALQWGGRSGGGGWAFFFFHQGAERDFPGGRLRARGGPRRRREGAAYAYRQRGSCESLFSRATAPPPADGAV